MSGNVAQHPKASTPKVGSGQFFQAYHFLLKQREKLDRTLLRMQEQLMQRVSKKAAQVAVPPKKEGKYVPRIGNELTLVEAIRQVMTPGKRYTTQGVMDELQNTGAYLTNSEKFYTMVNNKLNRDPRIDKPSGTRGIFVLLSDEAVKNKARNARRRKRRKQRAKT